MNNTHRSHRRAGRFIARHQNAIAVTIIVQCALIVIASLSGCGLIPVFGPSDAQLTAAKRRVRTLTDGVPAKPAAEARLRELTARRQAADNRASGLAGILNYALPGAGTLLAFAYASAQRFRSKEKHAALKATMLAINDFKKIGGENAVNTLMETLAKKHDDAGVRTAVRKALGELG